MKNLTTDILPAFHLYGSRPRHQLILSCGHISFQLKSADFDHCKILRLIFPNLRLVVPRSERKRITAYYPDTVCIYIEPSAELSGMKCVGSGPTRAQDDVILRRTGLSGRIFVGPGEGGFELQPRWEYQTTHRVQEIYASSNRGSLDESAEWTYQYRQISRENAPQEGVILTPDHIWSDWLVPHMDRCSQRIEFSITVQASLKQSSYKNFLRKKHHLNPETQDFFVLV